MGQLFEILNAGGIFMYALLGTSIAAVGFILHRVYSLWFKFRLNIETLQQAVQTKILDQDLGGAAQLCSGPHPLQRILHAAIERADRSEREIRRLVEIRAVGELARFRRGTAVLPQLSNLATLLGLLGTIHGLIISFSGMQGTDAATRQAALSKGVAVAFYNTFFGLTVATTTVIAYLVISGKQAREMTRMEETTASVVDQILTGPDERGAAPQPAMRVRR